MSVFYPKKFDNNGLREIWPVNSFYHFKNLYIKKKLSITDAPSHTNHLIMCDLIIDISMRIRAHFRETKPDSIFYVQVFDLLSSAYEHYRPQDFIDDRPLMDSSINQSRDLRALEALLSLTLEFKNLAWSQAISYKLCKYNALFSLAFENEMQKTIRSEKLENFIFLNNLLIAHNSRLIKEGLAPLKLANPELVASRIPEFVASSNPIEKINQWVDTALSFGFKKCGGFFNFGFLNNFSYQLKQQNGEEFLISLTKRLNTDILVDIFQFEDSYFENKIDNWDDISFYLTSNFDALIANHDAPQFLDRYGINLFTLAVIYNCMTDSQNYKEKVFFPMLEKLKTMGQSLVLPEKITIKQGNRLIREKKFYFSTTLSKLKDKQINLKKYFYHDLPVEAPEGYTYVVNMLEKLDLEKELPINSSIEWKKSSPQSFKI